MDSIKGENMINYWVENQENFDRCLRAMRQHGVKTIDELKKRIELLPASDERIFAMRWGLYGNYKYCPNFVRLGEAIDETPEDARVLYVSAEVKVISAVHLFSICDYEGLSFKVCVSLGRVAEKIKEYAEEPISAKTLKKYIDGLDFMERLSLMENTGKGIKIHHMIADRWETDVAIIRKAEVNALNKLREYHKNGIF